MRKYLNMVIVRSNDDDVTFSIHSLLSKVPSQRILEYDDGWVSNGDVASSSNGIKKDGDNDIRDVC